MKNITFATRNRGVAQLASALAWGARGRKFESSHPDFQKKDARERLFYFLACEYHVFFLYNFPEVY